MSAEWVSGKQPLELHGSISMSSMSLCVCLLQAGKKDSIGVRMALGETQIVTEIRQFLLDNGVALDSFSAVSFYTQTTHSHTRTHVHGL